MHDTFVNLSRIFFSLKSLRFWLVIILASGLSQYPRLTSASQAKRKVALVPTDEVEQKELVSEKIDRLLKTLTTESRPQVIFDTLQQLSLQTFVLFSGSKTETERRALEGSRKKKLRDLYRVLSDLDLLDYQYNLVSSGELCVNFRARIMNPWMLSGEVGTPTNELPEVDRMILKKVEEMCVRARD